MLPIQTDSPRLHQHINKHILNCTFCKSLTSTYLNMKEPYNQCINVQVTTKDIKKEDTLYMNSPAPEALCAKGICQIQSPFSVVNFANNVSILHITWHNFWDLLSTNLNDKSFHDSIEWSGIYLQVNIPLRLGKTFRFSLFRLQENPFVKLPLSMTWWSLIPP